MNSMLFFAQGAGFFGGNYVLDCIVFFGFIAAVLIVALSMSRQGGKDSEAYFLAGRGLGWWLIGFSLIAANISTEQFIGMSGNAAQCTGLAIASYEWIAAVTLVAVAFLFLPMFLRCGIYTIPQFLEYRYNKFARTLMSLSMMIVLVGVPMAVVIHSGALTITVLFGGLQPLGLFEINLVSASWFIGVLAAVYVFVGGLKACVWADLLQGSALILGGAVVMIFAFMALGAADVDELAQTPDHQRPAAYQGQDLAADVTEDMGAYERFEKLNADKLHMVRPLSDPNIVWTTLLLGIWIPNLYYWGLNQYIIQRTLGAQSLAEGQKGIVFAAALKLVIPFIVVFPGIIAFNLFSEKMVEEAETDKQANAGTWATFEELESAPSESTTVFPFNREFGELRPEKAVRVARFNAAVAGIEVSSEEPGALREELIAVLAPDKEVDPAEVETLAQVNDKVVGRVLAKNTEGISGAALVFTQLKETFGLFKGRYAAAKELVGYKHDAAFPLLLKNLKVPSGLRGFVLAALLGAVMSSLASMLNAASTIFTMDLYKEYFHRSASQGVMVIVGRICVVVFAALACWISPMLADPRFGGLFKFIQEFQGFISPGILSVFLIGLLMKRAPGFVGAMGLLVGPLVYGILMFSLGEMNFLNRMGITLAVVMGLMALFTLLNPRQTPLELPVNQEISLESSKAAVVFGLIVVALTGGLYIYFL